MSHKAGLLTNTLLWTQAGMFNDKSTHNERQEALQTVMRKGDAEVGEQVHSPAQLNKLLARSTDEFNIFQQVCP